MTCVAPGVRFSDFAIFVTPALALAIAFICRTSSLVHSRRTILLVLAIVAPVLWTGLVPHDSELATCMALHFDMKSTRACVYRAEGGALCVCQRQSTQVGSFVSAAIPATGNTSGNTYPDFALIAVVKLHRG
jgi:hypothetical protein